MSDKKLIASGKTKRVFADDNPKFVILEAIDRLTAGDAAKLAEIGSIGSEKTRQCTKIFEMFEAAGLDTAYVDIPSPVQLRCHAVEMLPIEFVMRRYPYGSYFKRNPQTQIEGAPQPNTKIICELFHKTAVLTPPLVDKVKQVSENAARDKYLGENGWPAGVYTDPFIENEGDEWAIYDAKKPIEGAPLTRIKAELGEDELNHIWNVLLIPAFTLLETKLASVDGEFAPIALVDIKFEIGRRRDNGALVIADVIDNDSWRIWPKGDPKAQLDKQGFRDGDGLDQVLKNYKIVTQIVEQF